MEKKVIEMLIKDFEDEVFAISVVTKPAIEENVIELSTQEIELKVVDEKRNILMGAILVPDKEILRLDKEGKPYYIKFSAETIQKASELFLMRSKQNNVTLQHKKPVDGMSLVESWVVVDSKMDKSAFYGLDYKPGTWVGLMKVDNLEVRKEIEECKIKGFSIEGKFSDNTELQEVSVIEQIKELLKQL
jgi:hypothetical protein